MSHHGSEAVLVRTAWHHADSGSPEADSRVSDNLYVIFNKQRRLLVRGRMVI